MQSLTTPDLESIIKDWQFWCNACHNRSCIVRSETDRLRVSERDTETKYLIVRTLLCERCSYPLILGTNVYYDQQGGWGARGHVMTVTNAKMYARVDVVGSASPHYRPQEYLAFTEPAQERELPKGLSVKIVESFKEAEYAVSKNKPISSAAAIRTTVRLIVEDNNIAEANLKEAIKQLPFEQEYLTALGNLKIIGDNTQHYEAYTTEELKPALEVLALALNQHATRLANLEKLHKAVSDKSPKKALKPTDLNN